MIAFRLSGEPRYLENAEEMAVSYRELLLGKVDGIAVDCGAYKGDSTQMMANVLNSEKIIACEPDPKTFAKLSAYAENERVSKIIPVNAAVGSEDGSLSFMASASRGSGKEGLSKSARTKDVPLRKIDSILNGESVDLLKLDVEGDEKDAILGAVNTIREHCPNMAVSVYHRTGDIFELPIMIRGYLPNFSFYLRREKCIPAWDITLFAVRN